MIPFIQGLKSKAIRSHIISLHKQEVSSGIKLNLYSYNGTVPGQEIRVKVGQQVEVNLKNELDQPVTIHWHGYPVPVDMDGVPGVTQNAVKPGESFQYSFTATVPGTYWYHSHYKSAEQVDLGLYGALIVEGDRQTELDRDYTFILDEMNSKGKAGSKGMMGSSNDDLFTVNGKSGDLISAYEIQTGENVRLRFINAGYITHYMNLGSIEYRVVAVDGQAVMDPQIIQNKLLPVGPGERYDVEFTAPDSSFFIREMLNTPAADGLIIPLINRTSKKTLDETEYDGIFTLTGSGIATEYASLASNKYDQEYKMVLSHGMKGMGMIYTINGRTYPDIDPLDVKRGDIIKVTLESKDMMFDHPMHLHGHFFQVLSKDGSPVEDGAIFKDTLVVKPGEKYELAFIANNPGEWMFHCHDLNHASSGMMTSVLYDGYAIPSHIDQSQPSE
ncbi:multicopper oxidase family protein [Paenibacillus validus]|uniref:multicopper oxidase family protein n=2 Tax=Paenibacillus TaxID=44249 RepID=UPI001F38E6C9|nr:MULTISPECIES: multicopper oxidase family protein [Paenibacillus]MED4599701.1 multicopper oxidase family protein [Paenibacillus validus]MED4604866.1 multicopper oxidase family protein [Paenibacillus validus]